MCYNYEFIEVELTEPWITSVHVFWQTFFGIEIVFIGI